MNSRPVFPTGWRKAGPGKAVLILLLTGILLQVTPVSALTPVGAMNVTESDDETILLSNATFWIRIDPVHDSVAGDTFFLSGETSLPENSSIFGGLEYFLRIEDPTMVCRTKVCHMEQFTSRNESPVLGNNSSNRFLIPLNTKELRPGTYYYVIHSDIGTYTSSYNFTLIPNVSASLPGKTSNQSQQSTDAGKTRKADSHFSLVFPMISISLVFVFVRTRKLREKN